MSISEVIILDGPNKDRLEDSLFLAVDIFYRYRVHKQIFISFYVGLGDIVREVILYGKRE